MTSVINPTFAWTPYTHSPLTKPLQTSSPAASIQEKHRDEDEVDHLPSSPTQSKFKPYLRKLSFRDQNLIDLSRPSAENYSTTGIGFYDEPRSPTDTVFAQNAAKSRHQRTTSNNSTFSIGSTLPTQQRPRAPYTIPYQQHTPRPYTPPIARSHTAHSPLGEDNYESKDVIALDDFGYKPRPDYIKRRSGSIGSLPVHQPQIVQMHSSSSLTMLNTSNHSESSLPSLPTTRSRGDTLRSIDTVGSSSRTSMEKALSGFNRGTSKDDPADAVTRAAQINAARIAFAQREEEKEQKALRQQEKASRKRQQKQERTRRKSESTSTNPSASDEKVEFVGVAYHDYTPAHVRTLPQHVPTTAGTIPRLERRGTKPESKGVKGRWLSFLAWFRTRLLRAGKKIHKKQR